MLQIFFIIINLTEIVEVEVFMKGENFNLTKIKLLKNS